MIVLSVHNHYQQAGGEDVSTALEVELLRSRGHEVVEYREHNHRIRDMSGAHVGLRTIWSQETYQRIRSVIREAKPAVVHVQNFFPLISPSVYYAARKEGVPVVQTLRNFRLLCANGLFLRDNKVCEDCLGLGGALHGIAHGCYRGDRAATLAVAAMQLTHRLARTWGRQVDLFVALTAFSRSKLIQGGVPAERIVVKPNFVEVSPGAVRSAPGSYMLFIGRLTQEKGVQTMLEAWRHLPGVPLKVVGSGPFEEEARRFILTNGLGGTVELLGRKTQREIWDLLRNARCLIFPSLWYEAFGRVAVEAFSAGVPVITSDIGSMAEIVDDSENGLHFRVGDAADLVTKVRYMLSNPAIQEVMRRNARAKYEALYTADRNYEMLMDIYRRVLGDRSLGNRPSPGPRGPTKTAHEDESIGTTSL